MAGDTQEGGPPAAPGRETAGAEVEQCDDWILATIDSWVHSGRPTDDIVEKVMTSFDLRELRTATLKLSSSGWVTPGFSVPQEATVNYSRRLAEVVVAGLTGIQITGVGPFCDQLGPPAVSSRLGLLNTLYSGINSTFICSTTQA